MSPLQLILSISLPNHTCLIVEYDSGQCGKKLSKKTRYLFIS